MAADANPAMICATIMMPTPGLAVINAIDASSMADPTRNTRSAPNFGPSLAPSMAKPATASEFATMAAPTVVGAV